MQNCGSERGDFTRSLIYDLSTFVAHYLTLQMLLLVGAFSSPSSAFGDYFCNLLYTYISYLKQNQIAKKVADKICIRNGWTACPFYDFTRLQLLPSR